MSLKGIPIGGWDRCVHQAAAFDSKPEYAVARLLDNDSRVTWWLRNDPPQIRVPTPLGNNFEPDFVYLIQYSDREVYGLLEVKNRYIWDGPLSDEQVKAKAASGWVRAISATESFGLWEFGLVLEQDALEAASFEQLRNAFAISSW